jgi:hypothetical protein
MVRNREMVVRNRETVVRNQEMVVINREMVRINRDGGNREMVNRGQEGRGELTN